MIMKKLLTLIIGLMSALTMTQAETTPNNPLTGKKVLIAYYSRAGQNYVSGDIVNLSVGNTAALAKKIHAITGGDLFEIRTVKSYPTDYHETTEVAQKELREKARPELVGDLPDVSSYDVVILGYPNWWGTMPMAVYSFIEKSGNLAGKTILPFCTHEGSGMGNSVRDLKKLCPAATVLPGLPIKGTRMYKNDPTVDTEVARWLQ